MEVVQDSPKTSLGIPVKTKNPLYRTMLPHAKPHFDFKLHERLVSVLSRERHFHHLFSRDPAPRPASVQQIQASRQLGEQKVSSQQRRGSPEPTGHATAGVGPSAILLALPVAALSKPIKILRLHH